MTKNEKILKRALEMACMRAPECPAYETGRKCKNCLTIGPKLPCYKVIAKWYIRKAKSELNRRKP